MIDEKDIDMSNADIDMPPLDYQMPSADQPANNPEHQLPPEIAAAQELERQTEQEALQLPQQQQPQFQKEVPKEDPVLISAKDKEANLRILREMNLQTMRERDELARKIQVYEASIQPKYEPQDEDLNIQEEDLVEGKHLVKAFKRIQQLEQQHKSYMQQNNATSAELKLRAQYTDFDKVVTLENVQMLSASYPELAKSINASTDLYDKASSTYMIIKKFGIYNPTPHEADKQKAIANSAKPRPSASVSAQQGSEGPLSRANAFAGGLTEELKEKLRKEMDLYANM